MVRVRVRRGEQPRHPLRDQHAPERQAVAHLLARHAQPRAGLAAAAVVVLGADVPRATCHGSTACGGRCRGGRSSELRGGPGASARLQELSSVRPSRPLALARGCDSHARPRALRCTPSDTTLWRGVARNGSGRPARRSSRRLPRWLWPGRWPVLLRRRRRARLEALRGTHRRFARARGNFAFGNWNNKPIVEASYGSPYVATSSPWRTIE